MGDDLAEAKTLERGGSAEDPETRLRSGGEPDHRLDLDDSEHPQETPAAQPVPAVESVAEAEAWKQKMGEAKSILLELVIYPAFVPEENTDKTQRVNFLVHHEAQIAKYAGLISHLEQQAYLRFSDIAVVGLRALQNGKINTADAIAEDISYVTMATVSLDYVLKGIFRFTWRAAVIFMIAFLALWLGHVAAAKEDWTKALPEFLASPVLAVLVAAVAGCAGSVVSLLLRLQEFEVMRGRSRQFLTSTGSTLPIVGGLFASVIAALLSGNLINLPFGGNGPNRLWTLLVLGFLSGFSERFSRNLLQLAESRLGGAAAAESKDRPDVTIATVPNPPAPTHPPAGLRERPTAPPEQAPARKRFMRRTGTST